MRKIKHLLPLLVLWIGTTLSIETGNQRALFQRMDGSAPSERIIGGESIPGACTSFTAQDSDTILFGNNEDYSNPNTYLWVEPSSEEAYGGIYLGYQKGEPQGGINEKGLAYDGLALSPARLNWDPELPYVQVSSTAFWGKVLRSCANVEEAIQMSTGYNWGRQINYQIIIADPSGDSAVLGAGPDGALTVTRKPLGDGFLVATNFNLANPDEADGGYPCPRYETATRMLQKIQDEGNLSVESVRDVLDAVHQEGSTNNTLYSNIFDLRNGVVYMFYWHQYGELVTLNVVEEVAKGAAITPIRDLFSEPTLAGAEMELGRYQGKVPLVGEKISLGWLVLSLICLFVLMLDLVRRQEFPWAMKLSWVLPVFFLGPFGLLIYWFSYGSPRQDPSKSSLGWRALGASALSASGVAATFVVLLAYFFYFNKSGNLGPFALLIPFTTGLLVFRSPFVTALTGCKYRTALGRLALVELISTPFSVGSFIGLNTLISAWLGDFYSKAVDPGNSLFWGVFAVYTFGALIASYPFHLWLDWKGILVWHGDFMGAEMEHPEARSLKALGLRQGWLPLALSVGVVVLVIAFGA